MEAKDAVQANGQTVALATLTLERPQWWKDEDRQRLVNWLREKATQFETVDFRDYDIKPNFRLMENK